MGTFSLQGAQAVTAAQDKGTVMVLKDHEGNPFTYTDGAGVEHECTARVAGQLSATYRKAEDAMRDRQLKRRSLTITAEMLTKQQLELTAACVLDWNLQDGDKPIPCTREHVIKVLTAAPWIRTDIEAVIADPARFLE